MPEWLIKRKKEELGRFKLPEVKETEVVELEEPPDPEETPPPPPPPDEPEDRVVKVKSSDWAGMPEELWLVILKW